MSKGAASIKDSIARLSGKQIYGIVAEVTSLDEDARTVDISPVDGSAPLVGVNLQANQDSATGVVLYPKVGSYVLAVMLNKHNAAVVLTDEIEKIEVKIEETTISVDKDGVIFNGGAETTVNATELKKQLDIMSTRITTIENAIKNGVPVAQDGGIAYQTTMKTILELNTSTETFDNIIDDTIKH